MEPECFCLVRLKCRCSYDAKTGWTPIRCVIWRSLIRPQFKVKALLWGVTKVSSISWVPKFKGDIIIKIQNRNGSCQMGGREVTGRLLKFFFLREDEWSRSYRVTKQHPSLPWNFMTHGFLDRSAFPDSGLSVPNRKSQIASDLKLQSPNLRNFPHIAV